MFLCCDVFLGSRLRSIMTHWKSEMVPQHLLPWLVNTTAPKHLISWFRHQMSSSCCSPQTTAVLQQASASDMKVRLFWLTFQSICQMLAHRTVVLVELPRAHFGSHPFGSCGMCFMWCDFQVWEWSQTLVLILASLSMDVAMAAAFPPAPVCHLHVTQDTHWVIRSQLFVNWIISGVTLFPVVMVRILFFPFVRLYASVLMTAGSRSEVLHFHECPSVSVDSRMELIWFWMLKVKCQDDGEL